MKVLQPAGLFFAAMRFVERFLISLAGISLAMRLSGMNQGATMELIALPALALFYIIAIPVLTGANARKPRAAWITGGLIFGMAMAYCLLSLLFYTLKWLDRSDMLENCSLLFGLMAGAAWWGWRRWKEPVFQALIIRAAVLMGIILAIAVIF